MTYIVAVRWTAKEGEGDEIARALRELEAPTLAEAGVLEWRPHRDPESPDTFFIFEVYADAGAYEAHTKTDHFAEWGVGHSFPRLAERRREFYQPLGS
jgi:quinol monooxygenase YgiN